MKRPLRDGLVLAAALALLWAPFLPSANPWTGRIFIDVRPPALLLVLGAGLGALALLGRRLHRVERWGLALLLFAAAGLQLAAALVQTILDRSLDLYFDLGHVPSLIGMFQDSVGPWRAAGTFALVVCAAVALVVAISWALGAWERALNRRGLAIAALVVTIPALVVGVLYRHFDMNFISFAATDDTADQARRLVRAASVMSGYDHRYDAALSTAAPAGNLATLAGRDVLLIYVESYGTAVLDDPRLAAKAEPALAAFADEARRQGFGVVSSRLVSPVFGAGSWLAHGTMASGLKLDPFLDRLVTESDRRTLGRDMKESGHETVAVMPGIKSPWPESTFWGFEADLFDAQLHYSGPQFGWFGIPDQYTLERFADAALTPDHPPLFAEIVLVSSHTPFAPVPPYVEDWRDAGRYDSVSPAQWSVISHSPDWQHLERSYVESIVYDFRTLGGFLAKVPGNGLVIILGDHQPPGIVSGETQPWTVPIHVLSRDPALLEPFRHAGYVDGAVPPRTGTVKGMESFLGDFLAFYSTAGS
ncbi:MAG TPA: hypothetical protein VL993_07990 [Stellaceae bacterium]|nr:hypothetical protein [Stellaceae bacterium]